VESQRTQASGPQAGPALPRWVQVPGYVVADIRRAADQYPKTYVSPGLIPRSEEFASCMTTYAPPRSAASARLWIAP
jgi:hypothetical protein